MAHSLVANNQHYLFLTISLHCDEWDFYAGPHNCGREKREGATAVHFCTGHTPVPYGCICSCPMTYCVSQS